MTVALASSVTLAADIAAAHVPDETGRRWYEAVIREAVELGEIRGRNRARAIVEAARWEQRQGEAPAMAFERARSRILTALAQAQIGEPL